MKKQNQAVDSKIIEMTSQKIIKNINLKNEQLATADDILNLALVISQHFMRDIHRNSVIGFLKREFKDADKLTASELCHKTVIYCLLDIRRSSHAMLSGWKCVLSIQDILNFEHDEKLAEDLIKLLDIGAEMPNYYNEINESGRKETL